MITIHCKQEQNLRHLDIKSVIRFRTENQLMQLVGVDLEESSVSIGGKHGE